MTNAIGAKLPAINPGGHAVEIHGGACRFKHQFAREIRLPEPDLIGAAGKPGAGDPVLIPGQNRICRNCVGNDQCQISARLAEGIRHIVVFQRIAVDGERSIMNGFRPDGNGLGKLRSPLRQLIDPRRLIGFNCNGVGRRSEDHGQIIDQITICRGAFGNREVNDPAAADTNRCASVHRQREAVFTVNNPLLILAGAGSGKTTVLVRRIAFIIRYGNAYFSDYVPYGTDEGRIAELERAMMLQPEAIREHILPQFANNACEPYRVLAITFTNKAANEIKERLARMFPDEAGTASDIWAGTFHSICVRILRQHGERMGYRPGFTIYDADDTKKRCLPL